MRINLAYILILFLSGCTFIPASVGCLDSKVPRVKPEYNQDFLLTYSDTNTGIVTEKLITCEYFYNAQCSARGNYWDWRQSPKIGEYQLTLNDGRKGKLLYPRCPNLMGINESQLNYTDIILSTGESIRISKKNGRWVNRVYDKVTKKPKLVFEVPFTINIKKI
ncbi:MAG: hypothetical protein V7744_11830 [Pseudomonadales bacterium]